MAHFNKIFPIILIILYIIYFSMIQLIYSLFYMKFHLINYDIERAFFVFCACILLFMPIIILIWKKQIEIKNNVLFLKYHFSIYMIYIFILYLLRKQIIIGNYYIEIPFRVFWLNQSNFSSFIMIYLYEYFYSIVSTIFFIFLPFCATFFIKKNSFITES